MNPRNTCRAPALLACRLALAAVGVAARGAASPANQRGSIGGAGSTAPAQASRLRRRRYVHRVPRDGRQVAADDAAREGAKRQDSFRQNQPGL